MNKSIDYRKLINDYKNRSKITECFCHRKSECRPPIKQAHSIQRNRRLSIIEAADEKGNSCVYTFTSFNSSEKRILEDLKPIGKGQASTFFGFCSYHDTELFKDIENNEFDGSNMHLFLHSYRSFAHSYHRKNEEYKLYHDNDSEYLKKLPKHLILMKRKILELALKDGLFHKGKLDDILDRREYDELEYIVYEKEGLFPFAVSSIMSPRVTYLNHALCNDDDSSEIFSQLMITLLPDKNKTFVIIAAFPEDSKAVRLLDELEELPDVKLEKAITSLIIANCENTFFSPLVWNSFSKKEKRLLMDELEDAFVNPKYLKKFFTSKFNFFDDRFEMKRLVKP